MTLVTVCQILMVFFLTGVALKRPSLHLNQVSFFLLLKILHYIFNNVVYTQMFFLCCLYIITGKTYRLRISNVGLKTCLNFRIQDHDMLLVETEGTYVQKRVYSSLDIHVGQSYSILVTAKTDPVGIYRSYYIFATARFTDSYLGGIALIRYPGSPLDPVGQGPLAPALQDFGSSVEQALSIR